MLSSTPQGNQSKPDPRSRWLWRSLRGAAGVLLLMTIVGTSQQAQTPNNTDRPYLLPEANRLPDKNDQMQMQQDQQSKKAGYGAANVERRKQLSDDATKLLELATELKKEIDKTDKDTLSVNVIRKAEMIEKLAKGVKEKMKLTAAGAS